MTRRNKNILTYLIGLAIGTALMFAVRLSKKESQPEPQPQGGANPPGMMTGNEVEIPAMPVASPSPRS